MKEGRRKKEEGRRKKEEGRRKKEEDGVHLKVPKKTVVGAEISGRDLIGSETFVLSATHTLRERTGYANPLPIYKNEMLPRRCLMEQQSIHLCLSGFIAVKKTESAIALAKNILNPRNFFHFFLTFHLTYQRIS